jgi:hypothetical protein
MSMLHLYAWLTTSALPTPLICSLPVESLTAGRILDDVTAAAAAVITVAAPPGCDGYCHMDLAEL